MRAIKDINNPVKETINPYNATSVEGP
jgi:hypothetical protein